MASDDTPDSPDAQESEAWKWTKAGGKILYELTPVADAQHLYEGLRDGNYGDVAFSAFNLATTLVPVGKIAKMAKMAKVAKEAKAAAKLAKEAEILEKEAQALKKANDAAQAARKEAEAAKALAEAKRLEQEANAAAKAKKTTQQAKATKSSKSPAECAGCKAAAAKKAAKSALHTNPSGVVKDRVESLRKAIPENSQGRITMSTAVVEDAKGNRSVLIGTSEPKGYLRPGVTINPGEKVVGGLKHAEQDLIDYAKANNLKVIDVGATRPVCPACVDAIKPSGANISTPLKKVPGK